MKTRALALFLAVVFALLAGPAWALVTSHGREHLGCSGWSEGLTAIVNHPARFSGQIGPFGPTSHFHYTGGTAVLNQILVQYAALGTQQHMLYLEAKSDPAVEGFKESETHDFNLSISQAGEGFIHLYTLGRIRLEELKIPAGVSVELLPAADQSADLAARAKQQAEHERVAAFVAEIAEPCSASLSSRRNQVP